MASIYGYEVVSSLPLSRLSGAPGSRGRIRVEPCDPGLLDRSGELIAWHEWPELDGIAFALARTGDTVLAWCSATGAFEIDPACASVRIARTSVDEACEHRLGTMAVPLLLSEMGELALHASAIAADAGAVLFCGASGRGKSTMALMASRLGHRVLTEDGAVVGLDEPGPVVWPGARGIRVDEAGARATHVRAGKGDWGDPPRCRRLVMLPSRLEAPGPARVAAVCHLAERGRELEVERLAPSEALPPLASSLIHTGGTAALRPAFAGLARLLERVPAFHVTMPDRISDARQATGSLLARVLR